jgi:hypothetical protein
MGTLVRDISLPNGGKIVIVVCTSPTSALRFSMTYLLQPEGYPNHLSDIEIASIQPKENSRISTATFSADDATIVGIEKVMRYFQYARRHLTQQRGAPLSFAKWSKSQENIEL